MAHCLPVVVALISASVIVNGLLWLLVALPGHCFVMATSFSPSAMVGNLLELASGVGIGGPGLEEDVVGSGWVGGTEGGMKTDAVAHSVILPPE